MSKEYFAIVSVLLGIIFILVIAGIVLSIFNSYEPVKLSLRDGYEGPLFGFVFMKSLPVVSLIITALIWKS